MDQSLYGDAFGEPEADLPSDPPPHAAPARRHHEDPLIAAERLIADSSSELTDEQSWDTYAQIDEQRQQARSATSLMNRFLANRRVSIQVRVGVAHEEAFDVRGELVDVGDGWIRLTERGTSHIVRTSALVSVAGLASEMANVGATANSSSSPRRSWPSLLREIARESGVIPVKLLRSDGLSMAVSIARVGQDYIDIRPERGQSSQTSETLLVPTSAIVMLTFR